MKTGFSESKHFEVYDAPLSLTYPPLEGWPVPELNQQPVRTVAGGIHQDAARLRTSAQRRGSKRHFIIIQEGLSA